MVQERERGFELNFAGANEVCQPPRCSTAPSPLPLRKSRRYGVFSIMHACSRDSHHQHCERLSVSSSTGCRIASSSRRSLAFPGASPSEDRCEEEEEERRGVLGAGGMERGAAGGASGSRVLCTSRQNMGRL